VLIDEFERKKSCLYPIMESFQELYSKFSIDILLHQAATKLISLSRKYLSCFSVLTNFFERFDLIFIFAQTLMFIWCEFLIFFFVFLLYFRLHTIDGYFKYITHYRNKKQEKKKKKKKEISISFSFYKKKTVRFHE